jgi:hypothetical protein
VSLERERGRERERERKRQGDRETGRVRKREGERGGGGGGLVQASGSVSLGAPAALPFPESESPGFVHCAAGKRPRSLSSARTPRLPDALSPAAPLVRVRVHYVSHSLSYSLMWPIWAVCVRSIH